MNDGRCYEAEPGAVDDAHVHEVLLGQAGFRHETLVALARTGPRVRRGTVVHQGDAAGGKLRHDPTQPLVDGNVEIDVDQCHGDPLRQGVGVQRRYVRLDELDRGAVPVTQELAHRFS